MIKMKSIVLASDLKKSIVKLPADGEDELRFRAVRGQIKGEKDESGGIFVGPQMLKSFVKEKERFTMSHLFDGTITRSVYEPERRLVLTTRGKSRPLLELVRACLLQAKLKYKVVVLGPGQKEPTDVADDDGEEEQEGEGTSPSGGKDQPHSPQLSNVQLAQQRLQLGASEQYLSRAFPKGEAANLKKQTSRMIGGTGENFSPVLTALALVEDGRSPENTADLESAARAYLKHAQKDYTDKDRRDPINQLKITTAEKILRDLETARTLMAPSPQTDSSRSSGDVEWQEQYGAVRHRLEQLVLAPGQPETKHIQALCDESEKVGTAGDFGRALSILNGVEGLLETAEHYEQERLHVAQALGKLTGGRIAKDQLTPLAQRYRQALGHGHVGEFEAAREALQDVIVLEKELLQRILVAQKDQKQQPSDTEGRGNSVDDWLLRAQRVRERLEHLESLDDKRLSMEIRRRFGEAELLADQGDAGRAMSLLNAVERMLDEAENPTPKIEPEVQYKHLMNACETTLNRLQESKVPEEKLKPLKQLCEKAQGLASTGRHDEAVEVLKRAQLLPMSLVQTVLWEKKATASLDNYKLPESLLKQGGQGSVYLLQHPNPEAPELLLKTGKSSEKEAAAYLQMGSHPNIARCLGMGKIGDEEGLLMEAIRGGEIGGVTKRLRQAMQSNEISHEEYWGVIQYTLQRILQGLSHMDDLGFVHMDIKPENVLFDDTTGDVKIIDLGLTTTSGDGKGGTPGFQAPETVYGKDGEGIGDSKADVFGVGTVLFTFGEGLSTFRYNKDRMPGVDTPAQYLDGQALQQGTSQVNEKTGERTMKPGAYGAETEYTKFVNWMLDPDPGKRPSLREALNHPFLKDRSIDDEKAKHLVKGGNLSLSLFSFANDWPRLRQNLMERGLTKDSADQFAKLALPMSTAYVDARGAYALKELEVKAPIVALQEEDNRLENELEALDTENIERKQAIEQRRDEIEQEVTLYDEDEEQRFADLNEFEDQLLAPVSELASALLNFVQKLELEATEPGVKRLWKGIGNKLDEDQLRDGINGTLSKA